MTLEEIKALAAAKIAGQGNQVDLGNALTAIIDGLADAIADSASATPKVGIVTENLDDNQAEITENRFGELLSYAILRYDGKDFIVCDDVTAVGQTVAGWDGIRGALFTHQLLADDTGTLDTHEQIVIYQDGSDKYYIGYISE